MITPSANVALIGFGEAGSILAEELAQRGCAVRVWDTRLAEPGFVVRMRNSIECARADVATSLADAIRGAKLIISAVACTSAAAVAHHCAALLGPGQIYLDINDVSPTTKRSSAALIEGSGAHYIDAAVLAPVATQRLAVPMLLGGLQATQVSLALNSLGFATRVASQDVGVAHDPPPSHPSPTTTQLPLRPVPRAELP